ncbi:MAG: DUF5678 domain-containing protein [Candidatus Methanofastidiosia archaeon]
MIEVLTESKEFWEDKNWAYENYSELVKRFSDQWIAIVDKKVICADPDLEKVEKKAREKTSKKHIPIIFIESGMNVY